MQGHVAARATISHSGAPPPQDPVRAHSPWPWVRSRAMGWKAHAAFETTAHAVRAMLGRWKIQGQVAVCGSHHQHWHSGVLHDLHAECRVSCGHPPCDLAQHLGGAAAAAAPRERDRVDVGGRRVDVQRRTADNGHALEALAKG
eukprot:CAMPEP_0179119306 /NCGR_PEP_ID=MMETSP0796-20121207/56156_1 /TAXON_ID=73915 /ORGANISM="Pyrodinium bahamense, Strain pbaha01" /LENGTH=143 /DNA_ID=CAMNT_0020817801 /DNA_START=1123 /DNA_END=1551 /DNA_ORIENTATION=-